MLWSIWTNSPKLRFSDSFSPGFPSKIRNIPKGAERNLMSSIEGVENGSFSSMTSQSSHRPHQQSAPVGGALSQLVRPSTYQGLRRTCSGGLSQGIRFAKSQSEGSWNSPSLSRRSFPAGLIPCTKSWKTATGPLLTVRAEPWPP